MLKVDTSPPPSFSIAGEGDTVRYFQPENGDDWMYYQPLNGAVPPEGALQSAKRSLSALSIAAVSRHT